MSPPPARRALLNRAGILIFAVSLANSLPGARARNDGVGGWDWIALSSLVGVAALAIVALWPYYIYRFRFDARELIDRYVDGRPSGSLADMHRELALRIESDMERNGHTIRRIRVACQFALILVLVKPIAWLLAIAS